jgi:hypothetical protein
MAVGEVDAVYLSSFDAASGAAVQLTALTHEKIHYVPLPFVKCAVPVAVCTAKAVPLKRNGSESDPK